MTNFYINSQRKLKSGKSLARMWLW